MGWESCKIYTQLRNLELMHTKNNSTFYHSVDQTRLSRLLVSVVLFVITILAATYVIKTGNRLYMIAVVVLPFAIMLSNRLDVAYVLMLLFGATGIGLPGAAHVPISWLMLLLMVGILFLNILMARSRDSIGKKAEGVKWLKAFAVIIIVLMIVRGAGIRALGGQTWGGTPYLVMLSGFAFYALGIPSITISRSQVKTVVIGGALLGCIGAFLRYRGFGEGENELLVGESRALWLRPLIMGVLPLVFIGFKPKFRALSILLFVCCLGLVMLTGFRSRFVMLLAVAFGYCFFKSKNKFGLVSGAIALGCVLWFVVVLISSSLPASMQRAVSFVPGATIDFKVAENAAHSVDWRVEIWGHAMNDLPEYWLLGRGVAFDVMSAVQELGLEAGLGGSFQAYHTHTYHSGPITLLIDFGIPGLVIYLGFMIFILKKSWVIAKEAAPINDWKHQYLLFLCVQQIWLVFTFWFIFGDVGYLSNLVMQMALIMIIYRSINYHTEQDSTDAVD